VLHEKKCLLTAGEVESRPKLLSANSSVAWSSFSPVYSCLVPRLVWSSAISCYCLSSRFSRSISSPGSSGSSSLSKGIQFFNEGARVIQLWVCGLVRWRCHLRRSLVIIDAKVCCRRFFCGSFLHAYDYCPQVNNIWNKKSIYQKLKKNSFATTIDINSTINPAART
jgi:hypothetical protein